MIFLDYWARISKRAGREALAIVGIPGWPPLLAWLLIYIGVGLLLPVLGSEGEAKSHWSTAIAAAIMTIAVFADRRHHVFHYRQA